ncbi:insulinoma-associated protein 1a-like [Corythoichthys intestinalis]|uniref:insulinoma-associated protein 1a-like n=1 Tax=Corythoichthys intestinalis TaxID=161448 RepID=UPI0025A65236|nr:insulinoma-associated protein 1a-like [Corythoichthys intestinalis]XP_061806339.1 insulinoma-associated protein 1a-like [Nerophis lumbriciformis]
MPRGFLVKRSKRVNLVSYRTPRTEDRNPSVPFARWPVAAPESKSVLFGDPEGAYRPLRSPARPTGAQRDAGRHPGPDLSSPASGEAFPAAAAALAALEHLFNVGSSTAASKPQRKVKRVKTVRKWNSDNDTASPVLGLKIRAAPERQPTGGGDGEFVCQLCKEAYADPLGLAQHRCSRIVRVEYRCPECDKAFGCPANLASHRRWHKPKTEQKGRAEEAPGPGTSESGSDGDEPHESARGGQKFKRHAFMGGSHGPAPHANCRHPSKDGSFILLARPADQVVGALTSRF